MGAAQTPVDQVSLLLAHRLTLDPMMRVRQLRPHFQDDRPINEYFLLCDGPSTSSWTCNEAVSKINPHGWTGVTLTRANSRVETTDLEGINQVKLHAAQRWLLGSWNRSRSPIRVSRLLLSVRPIHTVFGRTSDVAATARRCRCCRMFVGAADRFLQTKTGWNPAPAVERRSKDHIVLFLFCRGLTSNKYACAWLPRVVDALRVKRVSAASRLSRTPVEG